MKILQGLNSLEVHKLYTPPTKYVVDFSTSTTLDLLKDNLKKQEQPYMSIECGNALSNFVYDDTQKACSFITNSYLNQNPYNERLQFIFKYYVPKQITIVVYHPTKGVNDNCYFVIHRTNNYNETYDKAGFSFVIYGNKAGSTAITDTTNNNSFNVRTAENVMSRVAGWGTPNTKTLTGYTNPAQEYIDAVENNERLFGVCLFVPKGYPAGSLGSTSYPAGNYNSKIYFKSITFTF